MTVLTFETPNPQAGIILFHGGGLTHGSPDDLVSGAHLALLAAMSGADPGVAAIAALNPAGLDLASFAPEVRRRLNPASDGTG